MAITLQGRTVQGLEMYEAWASNWQQGPWSVARLPCDLDIRVQTWHGGAAILGVSFRDEQTIAINALVLETPLQVAVMLHEAAHLIGEPSPLALCDTRWRPIASEMLAWAGAGRLSVSATQIRLIDERQASCDEIGQDNDVPTGLIALGRAVHHKVMGLDHPGEYAHTLAGWRYAMELAVSLL